MKKPKRKYVLFWFKSNKGSDFKFVFQTYLSEAKIKERCEEWGDNIIRNGSYSESICKWGHKRVSLPSTRAELSAQYRKACEVKQRAINRWAILAAKLNPLELE